VLSMDFTPQAQSNTRLGPWNKDSSCNRVAPFAVDPNKLAHVASPMKVRHAVLDQDETNRRT
jgi:hypothetical protein